MYGLGATMYYAVEGELPFDKGQAIATLTSVMTDPPRRPHRAGALAPLIRALMAKDPGARPSASQVRSLLKPLVSSGPFLPPVDGGTLGPEQEFATGGRLVFDDLSETSEPTGAIPGITPGAAAAAGVAAASAGTAVGGRNLAELPPGVPERIHAEIALGWDQNSRLPGSTVARVIGVLLVALLAAGAIFFLSHLNKGASTKGRRGVAAGHHKQGKKGGPAAQPSAGATAPGAAPSASSPVVASAPSGGSTSSSGVVPVAGWTPYANNSVGWSISYPPGWAPVQRDSHVYDFVDPNGGRYLRVAWTTTPGPDPAARWQEYSKSFGARYPNYRTIGISQNFSFKGWKASAWEYTYSAGGTLLHAVDLALVNGTYGFALNFQTHDADWVASQPLFDAFKQSFQPPS
jgi:hypothetical protein